MTLTAYNPPAAGTCQPSGKTIDERDPVLAHILDVESELGDIDAAVLAVPARPLEPCTACVDDAAAGHWAPLDAQVSIVAVFGQRWPQDCCVIHARDYVADARQRGLAVIVEIPCLTVLDETAVAA